MLGQCKAFIKSEIGMIPFLGWAMWFNEFGFLTRAKASKDLKTLQRASEHFRGTGRTAHFYLHNKNVQGFQNGTIFAINTLVFKNTLNLVGFFYIQKGPDLPKKSMKLQLSLHVRNKFNQ